MTVAVYSWSQPSSLEFSEGVGVGSSEGVGVGVGSSDGVGVGVGSSDGVGVSVGVSLKISEGVGVFVGVFEEVRSEAVGWVASSGEEMLS